jgi:hypothetical protein
MYLGRKCNYDGKIKIIALSKLYKISANVYFVSKSNRSNTDYYTHNYWFLGLFPSSSIVENRKHDVSETGSVSVLRWGGGGGDPDLVGPDRKS